MDGLDINGILDRRSQENELLDALGRFADESPSLMARPGIYVAGPPGSGKTVFAKRLLAGAGYEVVTYDSSHSRGRSTVEQLASSTTGSRSVMGMLQSRAQSSIAVVLDEIDGMAGGDKGGLTALVKLIRPKRTERQKGELAVKSPVVCIGSAIMDKKVRELSKACTTIHLFKPEHSQVERIVAGCVPGLSEDQVGAFATAVDGDLHKVDLLARLARTGLRAGHIQTLVASRSATADSKTTTRNLLMRGTSFDAHARDVAEAERTVVSLLVHENIPRLLTTLPPTRILDVYGAILKRLQFGDCVDRATFQRQIWQLGEMNSLLKTADVLRLAHAGLAAKATPCLGAIEFTKILTKYSTQYNNGVFLRGLCGKTGFDLADLYAHFLGEQGGGLHKPPCLREGGHESQLDLNRLWRLLAGVRAS